MNNKEKYPKYSSYCETSNLRLVGAKVEALLKRLDSALEEDNECNGSDVLIGREARFSVDPGIDMLAEYDKQHIDEMVNHDIKCLINTDGEEKIFTDAVPYIRTSADPAEDITFVPVSHDQNEKNIISVQIDVYDIPQIQKTSDGILQDEMGINLGSDRERNRSLRITLFGRATVRYDPLMFSKMCELINNFKTLAKCKHSKGRECMTIGVNVNEAHTMVDQEFDQRIEMDWHTPSICKWPICIRTVGICYIISQNTPGLGGMEGTVLSEPSSEDKQVLRTIYDTAVVASQTACQAIQSYNVQSSIAHQMAEQAKWATRIGISLVLEICGIEVSGKLFEMVDVDAQCYNESNLRVTSISKGDGLPMMCSRAWNIMFPPGSLRGISKSPMTVANSIVYNFIVFGNQLGRLMAPVDNLFMYDYAADSRDKDLNRWISGARKKIGTTLKHMKPLQATSTLGNVMAYEMIRSKCRVEESSRRYDQVNKKMAIWKDLRTMLHYRVVDAAFLKIVPFTMLTVDEMDTIGFATLLHDAVDFGYDISVKEPSNTFLTLTEGKIDVDSAKKAYVRMANGLQYVLERYKYDACGLTFLATHYWQLANGRHRIIPSIYNGSCKYEHNYLHLEGGLVDVLKNSSNQLSKASTNAFQAAKEIRDAAKLLGPDAVAMAQLVTVDIAETYAEDIDISNVKALIIERKMCELSTSLAIGCDPDGKMTTFLWMICEYMWLKTGMMLSCLVGTLKIMHNRRQSDDRGGLGYKKWE